MNNRIILTPAKETRRLGREVLQGKWGKMFAANILAAIVIAVPVFIIAFLTVLAIPSSATENPTAGALLAVLLVFFVALVIGGLVESGVLYMFLNIARGKETGYGDIFYCFRYFGKFLGLMLMLVVRILLWTLLLIVPGIIAGLRYSQSIYIMLDDPSKGVNQCIEESKSMMNGNKWKFFCLSFSFIGWSILASLPDALVNILYENEMIAIGLYDVLTILTVIPVLLLNVYMYAAFSVFYQMLTGEREAMVAQTEEDAYVLGQPLFPQPAEEPEEAVQQSVSIDGEKKSEI